MRVSEKREGRRLEMRPTRIAACVAMGLALGLVSASAEGACSADAKPANLGLKFKDIHGKPFALSDYKGKVVLLDFWATWCPPCRKEIPGFMNLYDTYRSRGLMVIGVSMDDSKSDVKRFTKSLKMNYPILMGAGRDDLQSVFGELPLPTAFVIGRDGRICGKHDGETPKEQFVREIEALL